MARKSKRKSMADVKRTDKYSTATYSKLNRMLNECVAECNAIGIETKPISEEVIINTRADSFWGRCTTETKPKKMSYIEVTERLLKCDDKAIKETLMHEVLHATKDAVHHGSQWKRYAKQVNDTYGYHITRCSSSEEKGLKEEPVEKKYKYMLKCKSCGRENKYQRFTKVLQNPSRFRCSICKGDLEVISLDPNVAICSVIRR